jgi:DNA-directed RNA polymerase subunit N (RpoN/RPB10)
MKRIMPEIDSLEQHQKKLRDEPDAYRPERCPHCGKAGVHCHGHYERNAPRGEGVALLLETLLIPRFYCPTCRRTCSRLPGCLSPRRQYCWKAFWSNCFERMNLALAMGQLDQAGVSVTAFS